MKNTSTPLSMTRLLHILGHWSGGQEPLYRQLAQTLAALIQQGELPVNTVLPPERSLAKTLAVSRTTVATAYALLRQEGWIESRQGSGTRVLRRGNAHEMTTKHDHLLEPSRKRASPLLQHEKMLSTIDFSLAAPVATPVVTHVLASLIKDEGNELTTGQGYLVAGHPLLRQAVATYFTVKGIPTTDEQILVTTGAQQAIGLLAALYLEPGDDVIVENPTYPGALDIFRSLGAHIQAIPLDREGVRVDLLEESVSRRRPRLIYVTPTFHNPTGTVLSESRRRAVVRLAERFDIPLLEDATLADVLLETAPPPPLVWYQPQNSIVTVGSMSKLFWGGLRVGWIRASVQLIPRLTRLKMTADLGTSLLDQLLAARLLPQLEVIQAQRRQEFRFQREHMAEYLRAMLPSWHWQEPSGGLSLWVQLPSGNASEFVQMALRHGVIVVAGPRFSSDEAWHDYLRLSFASNTQTLKQGINRLAHAWQAYLEKEGIPPTLPSLIV